MSSVNLGRVQGAGIFYTTQTVLQDTPNGDKGIPKNTVYPKEISPLYNDSILLANGDLYRVTQIESGAFICVDESSRVSLKGAAGVGWFPATWGAGAATDLAVDEEIYNVINIGDYIVQSNDKTEVNKGGGLVYESLGLGSVWQVTSKSYSGGFYFVKTTPLNFTIRGAKGEDADPNSVLYVEQTLTDEQKQQARANIGAITASEAEVPVASQTQFGTVKVYTDSDGYLCIDTE